MEYIIALLIALLAFALGYTLVYRGQLTAARSQQQLGKSYEQPDAVAPTVDTGSIEYKLAQAGVRTANPPLTWALLHWGPAAACLAVSLFAGMPLTVALAAGAIGFIAPRQWLGGRIKDRGRRMDGEMPKAYVSLLSVLSANPDVGLAMTEVADTLELEHGGPTPLSTEFRITVSEMADNQIGREEGLRRMQKRAASVSLSNLGLLLERFAQTAAGGGGSRFYSAFETAAQNVQGILDARGRAQAKAAEQIQSARIIPGLLAATMLFFMNDVSFAASFRLPMVQIALAATVVVMFVGYGIMSDIAKEAV